MYDFIDYCDVLKANSIKDYGILYKIDRSCNLINTVDPIITKSCNLCCPHCWGNNNGCELMDMENYKKILELANYLNINLIQYTGGEPLLHPNLFDFARKSRNLNFKNRLRTNFATKILDKQFLVNILECFDSIYISLDGIAEDNFYLRPSKKFMNLKKNNSEKAKEKFIKYANESFDIIRINLDNLIKIKKEYNYKNKVIIASVVQRYNLNKIIKLTDFINQYEDIRWDITQITVSKKDDINDITSKEFLSTIFKIIKLSNNTVKIKTTSSPRCLRFDSEGNVLLSNNNDIIIGNYISNDIDNFDRIKNVISQLDNNIKTHYYNYIYIPFKKF